MTKYALPMVTIVIIISLSVPFYLTQKAMNEEIRKLRGRDELVLKKLSITNKFGDTIIELTENENFNASVSLYNKENINTIHLNGGNRDQNPGIIMLKGKDEASFALMVEDKRNVLAIYNRNGLDAVTLGTDEAGHGGYSIKNAHGKIIKTEGWGWRAYLE